MLKPRTPPFAGEYDFTSLCPHCGAEHEFASEIFETTHSNIKAGDTSLCVTCGRFSVLDRDGIMLRKPNRKELRRIAKDKRCTAVFLAWLMAIAGRQP